MQKRAGYFAAAAIATAFAVVMGAFAGCGGVTADGNGNTGPDDSDGGDDAEAGSGGRAGSGGTTAYRDGGKDSPDVPHDAYSEYSDPGCPNAPPKVVDMECDLASLGKGVCPLGTVCSPFVEYPMGDPCGTETYGTTCVNEGSGTQGESCDDGCAGGYLCVVSGQGTQCVKLCDLTAPLPCSGGLLCMAVDIPGIGGCLLARERELHFSSFQSSSRAAGGRR